VQDGRNLIEYVQAQPGKYITAAVGRLVPVGERRVGPVTLTGYGISRTRGEAERSLELAEGIQPSSSRSAGHPLRLHQPYSDRG
jgi:hypothetical protein